MKFVMLKVKSYIKCKHTLCACPERCLDQIPLMLCDMTSCTPLLFIKFLNVGFVNSF